MYTHSRMILVRIYSSSIFAAFQIICNANWCAVAEKSGRLFGSTCTWLGQCNYCLYLHCVHFYRILTKGCRSSRLGPIISFLSMTLLPFWWFLFCFTWQVIFFTPKSSKILVLCMQHINNTIRWLDTWNMQVKLYHVLDRSKTSSQDGTFYLVDCMGYIGTETGWTCTTEIE